jgi:hypothetical protein
MMSELSPRGGLVVLTMAALLGPVDAAATPQFAREFGVPCSACHSAPPVLNERGEDFVARGYRFEVDPALAGSMRTFPLAMWSTLDLERRSDVTKGFPGRVELISGGRVGSTRASYFAELRLVSLQIGSGNALLNRSGRFEDLFVTMPVGDSPLQVTVGQFRGLSQVDVSRRLSISEPLVFSAGLPGPAAGSARLTGLRAFAPSGRQPAVRLTWVAPGGARLADGWTTSVTLPLTGELTLPFTEAASFEFEARPKGVFVESFARRGLTTVGGHAFVGDDRLLLQQVNVLSPAADVLVTGAIGLERVAGESAGRYGVQAEWFATNRVALACRFEDRTGAGRRAAGVLTFNAHLPFGPPPFRQALRLQVEQRVPPGGRRTLLALSHVF